MLDLSKNCDFDRLLILGHPGKLAKLTMGYWDTHSSRSGSAVPSGNGPIGKNIWSSAAAKVLLSRVFSVNLRQLIKKNWLTNLRPRFDGKFPAVY